MREYISLEDVKNNIKNNLGKEIKIKYNLGRNKYETYNVILDSAYNNIFIVRKDEIIKSFTYNDIITKIIKIDY